MKKRQSAKKTQSVQKGQDIDRSFVVIPEVIPDQWRENLDVFFDENETGLDHVRYLMDISKTDVDRYYFTGGYDISDLIPKKPEVSLHPERYMTLAMRPGDIAPVYESAGSFRYAVPQ